MFIHFTWDIVPKVVRTEDIVLDSFSAPFRRARLESADTLPRLILFQVRSADSFVFCGFSFAPLLDDPRSFSNRSCRRWRRFRELRTISGEFRTLSTSRWNVNETLRESGRIFVNRIVQSYRRNPKAPRPRQSWTVLNRIEWRNVITTVGNRFWTIFLTTWYPVVTARRETPITFLWDPAQPAPWRTTWLVDSELNCEIFAEIAIFWNLVNAIFLPFTLFWYFVSFQCSILFFSLQKNVIRASIALSKVPRIFYISRNCDSENSGFRILKIRNLE